MTDLSIVVVSYNTRELLHRCLDSLEAGCEEMRTETFVVDNASRDDSADMVEHDFPRVTLIRNDRNAGFAAANNLALERAAGRHVVLLNSDTVVRPGALGELVRFMDDTPKAGYCGPRLLNPDGTHQPSAKRFPTVFSGGFAMLSFSRKYPVSRHALDLHAQHGDAERFRADWLTGACLVVRADAMRRVGPLDDGFFMYFEETDWCKRMHAAGWEGWYVPSAEVVHYGGGSVGIDRMQAPFFGNHPVYWIASRRRFMRRYYGLAGVALSEAVDMGLYAALWMRHRWRSSPESRLKAQRASQALRHLVRSAPPAST